MHFHRHLTRPKKLPLQSKHQTCKLLLQLHTHRPDAEHVQVAQLVGAEQVRQLAGRREQALEVQPQLWIGRLRSASRWTVDGII